MPYPVVLLKHKYNQKAIPEKPAGNLTWWDGYH